MDSVLEHRVHENYESINQNPADVHYYVFFCFMESVGKNLLPVFAVFLLVFLFIETPYKYIVQVYKRGRVEL